MQAIVQNNYLIVELDEKDSPLFANPKYIVGHTGENFVHKKSKEYRSQLKYGIKSIKNENSDGMVNLILASRENNIIRFSVEEGRSFYASLNSILAFTERVRIVKHNRNFFSHSTKDTLVLVKGPGEIFLQNAAPKLLMLNIEQQNNQFNANSIIVFEEGLFFKIKKNDSRKNTVAFTGQGKIFLGTQDG